MDVFLDFIGFVLFTLKLPYALLSALCVYTLSFFVGDYAPLTIKQRVLAAGAKTATWNLPLWVVRRLFVWLGHADRIWLGVWGKAVEQKWCRQLRMFDASEDAPWGAYLIAEDAACSEVGENADVVLLYAHGGGFILGGPLISFAVFVKWINSWKTAHNANAHIVSLKYGLSPEYPYPNQRNAFIKCYQWLVNEKGIKPSKIFFAGDSAGGNLSITSALHILHNPLPELPLPAGILAISPPAIASVTSSSWTTHLCDDALSKDWYSRCVKFYDSDSVGEPGMIPGISPLLDKQLKGMPRTWICLGQCEVLKDDAVEFANQAKAANVDVSLVVEKNQLHDYAVMWAIAEHGAEYTAMKQMGVFLFGEKAIKN